MTQRRGRSREYNNRRKPGEVVEFHSGEVPARILKAGREYRLHSASLYRNNWRIVRAVYKRIH